MNTTHELSELAKSLRQQAEHARFMEYREVGIGLDQAAEQIEKRIANIMSEAILTGEVAA